jgi:transketolase
MRKAFVNKLTQLVSKNKDIYLLTGDLGFSVFDEFKKNYPDNYLNVGVSESNMIGMAAGLALAGKQVFVYSIIPFVTLRCLEQIRNDLCYQRLPVKIIGVGEGLSYGTAGATHHALEDIAIMSALPEMTVIAPGDPIEVECTVENSLELKGPCYIRLGKTGEPILHKKEFSFKIGKAIVLKNGQDLTLITTGNMLETTLEVSNILKKENIYSKVVSMHTIKPVDREIIVKSANNMDIIVSIEEHSKIGGLGSHIANVILEERLNTKYLQIALPDTFIHIVGSQNYLREIYGLTPVQISAKILNFIKKG